MRLSILSSGVVCPGGFDSAALRRAMPLTPVRNAAGTAEFEVALVDRNAPELRRWDNEPRLRRASPITTYLTEAARQALDRVPDLNRQRVGVVSAFFLGCLVYTVRFYRQITEQGRRSASPVIFPETVFNSPLSHVVSVLGLGGPVYSQVGDTSCWAGALRTAQVWLARGTADQVLILGAEEFEPHQLDAYHAGGLFRHPLQVGEGAGALLVGRDGAGAGLLAVHDGYSFGNAREAGEAARRCMENVAADCPVLDTASGWMTGPAARAMGSRRILSAAPGPLVEASTASCAWNTIRAAEMLGESGEPEIAVPYWGLTQQCALAVCAGAPRSSSLPSAPAAPTRPGRKE